MKAVRNKTFTSGKRMAQMWSTVLLLALVQAMWAANNPDISVALGVGGKDHVQLGRTTSLTATLAWPASVTPVNGTFTWTVTPAGALTFDNATQAGSSTSTVVVTGIVAGTATVKVKWATSSGNYSSPEATKQIVVVDLKHSTIKMAANGTTPRTRTTVGVCEEVKFWLDPAPGSVSWSASGGTPSTSTLQEYLWTAPEVGGEITITATSDDTSYTVNMTVIPPSSISAVKVADFSTAGAVFDGNAGEIPSGWAGAGMFLQLTLQPTTVCFGNLNWREGAAPMTGQSGYFLTQTAPHPATPVAGGYEVADDNDNLDDTAAFTVQPPIASGSFTWSIPQRYLKRGASGDHPIYTVDQTCTIAPNFSATVSKFGVTSESRTP